ncbi:MAG: hypothetical protein QXE31_03650 [Candidatus Woesearchaeota archaeon]
MKSNLEKIFKRVKEKKTFFLILIIILLIFFIYLNLIKQILFSAIIIAIASITKIYHKFIKTTLSIDLIFFSTLLICFAYKNFILSITFSLIGLIIADYLAQKLNQNTLISAFTLILTILFFNLLNSLKIDIIIIAIFLMLLYEILASFLYNLIGSSKDKIVLFFISHFLTNLFLILNYLKQILELIS